MRKFVDKKRAYLALTSLSVEQLEKRELLTADLGLSLAESTLQSGRADVAYHPVIVAGVQTTDPATSDSPDQRVTDLFPGVGSLYMTKGGPSGYICTGTLISEEHVLTAGHCLDSNNDGSADFKPSNVSFRTIMKDTNGNYVYDQERTSAALFVNPDFSGFNGYNVNDDIAIIKLSRPITNSVVYNRGTVASGEKITLVGFGQSGTGTTGYTVSPSLAIKRLGFNVVNPGFGGQDDVGAPAANEVFYADFDGPSGNGTDGQPTLGNNLEATLGGGDSGGPSFNVNGEIVGINTFTIDNATARAPYFGSEFGGILVAAYEEWISLVLSGGGGSEGGGGKGGGGGGKGGGKPRAEQISYLAAPSVTFIMLNDSRSSANASEAAKTPKLHTDQPRAGVLNQDFTVEVGKQTWGINVPATLPTFEPKDPTDEDATDTDIAHTRLVDQLLEFWQ